MLSGHFLQKRKKKNKGSSKRLKSDYRRNRSHHQIKKKHAKAIENSSDSEYSSDSSVLDSSASDGGKTIKNYSKAIAGKVRHKIHQKEKMNMIHFQNLAKENKILKKSLKEMDKQLSAKDKNISTLKEKNIELSTINSELLKKKESYSNHK